MTSPETDEWPTYNLGSKDHLHAVGVLVAAWAEVERAYQCFIQFLFEDKVSLALRVNELLGNQSRSQLISDECIQRAQPQFEEHIKHFLKCAAVCKENRNAVAHAHFMPSNDPEFAILDKGRDRKKAKTRIYRFDVATLREMADEIHTIAEYGMSIWALMELARTTIINPGSAPPHMALAAKVPLLGKPPQPRKWDLRSQEQPQSARPPHQSSGV